MKKQLAYLLSVALLLCCTHVQKKSGDAPEVSEQLSEIKVNNNNESWGGDISMNIKSIEKINPELSKYIIISSYKNAPAGFMMLIRKPRDKKQFISDGIVFKPLGGDTSNLFLKALSEIYNIKSTINPVFKDSIVVTYYDLAGSVDTNNPSNWVAAQMKLFFPSDEDTPELFLNIDEKNRVIEFPEKDSSYRAGIINAISQSQSSK